MAGARGEVVASVSPHRRLFGQPARVGEDEADFVRVCDPVQSVLGRAGSRSDAWSREHRSLTTALGEVREDETMIRFGLRRNTSHGLQGRTVHVETRFRHDLKNRLGPSWRDGTVREDLDESNLPTLD